MKRVIVQVKYAKPKKDYLKDGGKKRDDGLDAKTRRIIGKYDDDEEEERDVAEVFQEMFSEENLEVYYKPYCLHLSTVQDFYTTDDGHTILITDYAGQLPILIKWNDWLAIWEKETGEAIFILGDLAPYAKDNNNQK